MAQASGGAIYSERTNHVTSNSPSKTDNTFITQQEKTEKHLSAETVELNQDLNEIITHIEGHFVRTMGAHEQDFKNAYCVYMNKVGKELQFLKEKSNEANGKLMNDDRITNLQDSIKWFKREALSLNDILNEKKCRIEIERNKRREMKENVDYLHKNLKEQMKQNKLLNMAAERSHKQNDALQKFFVKNATK